MAPLHNLRKGRERENRGGGEEDEFLLLLQDLPEVTRTPRVFFGVGE